MDPNNVGDIATMSLTVIEIGLFSFCLEGGLFGQLFYYESVKIDNNPIPGIYSGIFAIHLALHAAKRETDSSTPKITFYALCVLYVLTGAVFAIDVVPVVSNCIFFSVQLLATVEPLVTHTSHNP
jgi:hypothetical protein